MVPIELPGFSRQRRQRRPAGVKREQGGGIIRGSAHRIQLGGLTAVEHRRDAGPAGGDDRQPGAQRFHQDDRRGLGGIMGREKEHVRPAICAPLFFRDQLAREFHHRLQSRFGPQPVRFVFKVLRKPFADETEFKIPLPALFLEQGRGPQDFEHPLALLQTADKQHGQRLALWTPAPFQFRHFDPARAPLPGLRGKHLVRRNRFLGHLQGHVGPLIDERSEQPPQSRTPHEDRQAARVIDENRGSRQIADGR